MQRDLRHVAPAGHYAALRLGFFSPEEELNTFPAAWIDHYTVNGLALHDPLMRWIYSGSGARRWSDLGLPDPMGGPVRLLPDSACRYGAVVCVTADEDRPRRTFGYFARADRELTDGELRELEATLRAVHFHETEAEQAPDPRPDRGAAAAVARNAAQGDRPCAGHLRKCGEGAAEKCYVPDGCAHTCSGRLDRGAAGAAEISAGRIGNPHEGYHRPFNGAGQHGELRGVHRQLCARAGGRIRLLCHDELR